MKIIRDCIWGDIEVNDLELEVIDTPQFQRLRNIRQLGTTHLVFPTALHTRFDHSLGTLHTSQLIINYLVKKKAEINQNSVQLIRLACLLHDITHIPYGHTFEDEWNIFPRHDGNVDRWEKIMADSELGSVLEKSGFKELIYNLIFNRNSNYMSEIISGCISADLLDYLKRDAWFCGLPNYYDPRLFWYFKVSDDKFYIELNKRGIFREDAFTEVVNLLRARYIMTERVYYHHAKIASSVMINKLLEFGIQQGLDVEKLTQWGDQQLIEELGRFSSKQISVNQVYQDFMSRRLFKRCFLHQRRDVPKQKVADLYLNNQNIRNDMIRAISSQLDLPPHHIGIYCPPLDMYLKPANALCEPEPGKLIKLCELHNSDIENLVKKYHGIWKIYVFISASHHDLIGPAGKIAEEVLDIENELPRTIQGYLRYER